MENTPQGLAIAGSEQVKTRLPRGEVNVQPPYIFFSFYFSIKVIPEPTSLESDQNLGVSYKH